MRFGLAQTDIIWKDTQKNKQKAVEFFEKAAENQVDILIFPEMSLTGFSMDVEETTANWTEQIEFFKEMSRVHGLTTVFGYAALVKDRELEKHPNWKKYRNCLAVAQDGKIRMSYAKMHPFTYGQEGEHFQGGEQIMAMKWKDTILGAFICYDLRFPEIFQISSAKSEMIVVIANWPESRISQWDCLLQARAIENQCYVAGVNRVGEGGGITYNGHSVLFGPMGERMTVLCEQESLLIGDADLEKVRRLRETFPVKQDRRETLYKKDYLIFV